LPIGVFRFENERHDIEPPPGSIVHIVKNRLVIANYAMSALRPLFRQTRTAPQFSG
jgi:hypothetical protein